MDKAIKLLIPFLGYHDLTLLITEIRKKQFPTVLHRESMSPQYNSICFLLPEIDAQMLARIEMTVVEEMMRLLLKRQKEFYPLDSDDEDYLVEKTTQYNEKLVKELNYSDDESPVKPLAKNVILDSDDEALVKGKAAADSDDEAPVKPVNWLSKRIKAKRAVAKKRAIDSDTDSEEPLNTFNSCCAQTVKNMAVIDYASFSRMENIGECCKIALNAAVVEKGEKLWEMYHKRLNENYYIDVVSECYLLLDEAEFNVLDSNLRLATPAHDTSKYDCVLKYLENKFKQFKEENVPKGFSNNDWERIYG